MHTYLLQQLYPKHLIYRRGNLKMNHNFPLYFSCGAPRPGAPRGGAQVILRPGWGAGAVRKRPTPRS